MLRGTVTCRNALRFFCYRSVITVLADTLQAQFDIHIGFILEDNPISTYGITLE